jgi:hypothetical protein
VSTTPEDLLLDSDKAVRADEAYALPNGALLSSDERGWWVTWDEPNFGNPDVISRYADNVPWMVVPVLIASPGVRKLR